MDDSSRQSANANITRSPLSPSLSLSLSLSPSISLSPAERRPAVALEAKVGMAQAAGGLAPTAGDVDHVGSLVLRAERRSLVALRDRAGEGGVYIFSYLKFQVDGI